MTAPDLAAVCRAHGIVTACDPISGRWVAGYDTEHTQRLHTAETEADAVCALLKARYQIKTNPPQWDRVQWIATNHTGNLPRVWAGETELDAVVRAADRLKDGAA
jgi:hypothetical protein